jgi:hypothetical protein
MGVINRQGTSSATLICADGEHIVRPSKRDIFEEGEHLGDWADSGCSATADFAVSLKRKP